MDGEGTIYILAFVGLLVLIILIIIAYILMKRERAVYTYGYKGIKI